MLLSEIHLLANVWFRPKQLMSIPPLCYLICITISMWKLKLGHVNA